MHAKSLQSATFCDPVDPVEWAAMPFSRGIFPTQGSYSPLLHVPALTGRFLTLAPPKYHVFDLSILVPSRESHPTFPSFLS